MEFCLAGLAILFVASNIFWGWVTHRLINKLMSRTFWEYQEAKMVPDEKRAELKKTLKVPQGPNELDALDEMIQKVMPL